MPAKNPNIHEKTTRLLQALGLRIRQQRKALKVNATVASEAGGMSRVTWHRIEKGEPAVTMGAYLNALDAVGLGFSIADQDNVKNNDQHGWIPARIRLSDYPQLQQLAWHVPASEALTPREALDIYESNLRHLDTNAMTEKEQQLLEALRLAFGSKGSESLILIKDQNQ